MKSCIISLATADSDHFLRGLSRLQESLERVDFRGDFVSWNEDPPHGSPSHFEAPHAFKAFCFVEAKRLGYDLILWLDSSIIAVRSLSNVFDEIQTKGHLLVKNTGCVGAWSADLTLEILATTRETAYGMAECQGGVVGLNMRNTDSVEFLRQWHELATEQLAFRGVQDVIRDWDDYDDLKWNKSGRISTDPEVLGHRHDQTVLSILAHQLGMRLSPRNVIVENLNEVCLNQEAVFVIDRAHEISMDSFVFRRLDSSFVRTLARVTASVRFRARKSRVFRRLDSSLVRTLARVTASVRFRARKFRER